MARQIVRAAVLYDFDCIGFVYVSSNMLLYDIKKSTTSARSQLCYN